MINDVVNFLPHFLGIFPSTRVICIFLFLLGFPFITQIFAFNFNPKEIIYWVSIAWASVDAAAPRSFLVLTLIVSPSMKRHLNLWEDKDMMSRRFHSQSLKQKAASETRDVIYFHIVCCSLRLFGMMWEKKKRKNAEPSFCEGSLNDLNVSGLEINQNIISLSRSFHRNSS